MGAYPDGPDSHSVGVDEGVSKVGVLEMGEASSLSVCATSLMLLCIKQDHPTSGTQDVSEPY